jgi:hypothetical protein
MQTKTSPELSSNPSPISVRGSTMGITPIEPIKIDSIYIPRT